MLERRIPGWQIVCAICLLQAATACSRNPDAAARSSIESGDGYAKKGSYREAAIEYRNAVKALPGSVEAHARLADAAARADDPQTAMVEVLQVARLAPGDVSAQVRAGSVYVLAGRFEEARDRATAALQIDPDHAAAHVVLGQALAGLHDAGGSEEQFSRAVRLDPASADARIALGSVFWAKGKHEEAEKELQRAVELAPMDGGANRALALLYMASGRAAKAEPLWRTVSGQSGGALALADYYIATGRLTDAERDLEKRVAQPPVRDVKDVSDAARIRLAGVQYSLGKRDAAHATLQSIPADSRVHVDALLLRSRFLLAEHDLKGALAAAEAATASDSTSSVAASAKGAVLAAMGRDDDAAQAFQAAFTADARNSVAATGIAAIRLRQGHAWDAVGWAERARKVNEDDFAARLVLIEALAGAGQSSRAEEEARAVAAAWPDVMAAQVEFAAVLASVGKAADARRAYEKALTLRASDSPASLLLAAQAYAATGARDRAETSLTRALELDPSNRQAHAALGKLYLATDRLDAARQQFEHLSEAAPEPSAGTMVGMILEQEGRGAEARQRYEETLARHPRAGVAANNLAWLYFQEGRLDDALKFARAAKEALPSAPEINDTLGWIYYNRGQPLDAIPPLTESVASRPDYPLYRYHLGLTYWKAGYKDRARTELQAVLESKTPFAGRDEASRLLKQLTQ